MARKIVIALLFALIIPMAMAGETIRVVANVHPWAEAVKTLLPKFEAETGIKVIMETYGEDQLSQKLTVEFTASNGSGIDVFLTRPPQEARMMVKNGWYADLTPYIKSDAAYDFEDFTEAARNATNFNNIQIAIPLINECMLVYYRKDLFEAKGIQPPTSLVEMEEAAKKLNDPANGIAGFVGRGQRSALVSIFSSYVYNFESDFYDMQTRKSLVNTPNFIKAAKYYGGLLKNYGPAGVSNMHWMQAVAVFAQGKAAMYPEVSSLYPNFTDPAKSPYADKTGIVMFPKGANVHKVGGSTAWALAMSAGSQHKDAAWKFIRYMTSKESTLITQGQFMNPSARQSVYKIPEGVAKFPADWAKAVAASGPLSVGRDRPGVIAVGESRDIVGEVVVTAIEGGDVEATASRVSLKFQELLDREAKE